MIFKQNELKVHTKTRALSKDACFHLPWGLSHSNIAEYESTSQPSGLEQYLQGRSNNHELLQHFCLWPVCNVNAGWKPALKEIWGHTHDYHSNTHVYTWYTTHLHCPHWVTIHLHMFLTNKLVIVKLASVKSLERLIFIYTWYSRPVLSPFLYQQHLPKMLCPAQISASFCRHLLLAWLTYLYHQTVLLYHPENIHKSTGKNNVFLWFHVNLIHVNNWKA